MDTQDGPVRRHIITECGGGPQGKRCADALGRAMVHNGIEHLDPDKASRLAVACWLAEDEALSAAGELIDWLHALRESITNTDEVAPDKDSRSWNCDVSAGEMDRLVHAMRRLTDARRSARPASH